MTHFDLKTKDKYFNNLRTVLKAEDIRLGQFEIDNGFTRGQTARWENSEYDINPGIEYFIAAKKATGISIDTMLEIDMSGINQDELYMIRVLDSIIRDTLSKRISWHLAEPKNKEMYESLELRYTSKGNTIDLTQSYATTLPGGAGDIYLIHKAGAIDVYNCLYRIADFICSTEGSSDAVNEMIEKLHNTIEGMATEYSLQPDVKNRLDCYLQSKQPKVPRHRKVVVTTNDISPDLIMKNEDSVPMIVESKVINSDKKSARNKEWKGKEAFLNDPDRRYAILREILGEENDE